MNRFGKITSGVLLCLIIISQLLWWHKHEELRSDIYEITAILMLPPIVLGVLLKLIFRKSKNHNILQLLPNGLNLLSILFTLIMISWYFDPLTFYDKAQLEQKHLEKAVQKWIQENALYPDSYKPLYFSDFTQDVRPKIIETKDIEPIGYTIREHHKDSIEFAYYFLTHKHILKNKSGRLDTIIAYFRISTDYLIKDVHLENDSTVSSTANQWRRLYGNSNKNLELELNGNSSETYYFRLLITKFSVDSLHWELHQYLFPYSNGQLNGIAYSINDGGDTIARRTYRNGELNGINVSFNAKKDTTEILNYKDGKLDGFRYYFSREGKRNALVNYKDGIINGITEEIYPNGNIAYRGNCINGKTYGLFTMWYSNGKKSEEGVRVKDIEIGIWKYWDESGKLIKTQDKGNMQLLDSIPKLQ